MRTYTILFSIAAHTIAVLSVVVITVSATDVLPEPRRASEFIVVKPNMPTAPPAVRRVVRRRSAAAASVNAAPVDAPHGVRAETGLEAIPDATGPLDGLVIGDPAAIVAAEPAPPLPPPPPVVRPIRVGGGIRPPAKVHDVAPIYPAIAQSARVEGVVILEAVIAEDGSVRDVRILRSIPLLDQAAVDAVRHWRFTPSLLNGEPVPIVMTVTVSFTLH